MGTILLLGLGLLVSINVWLWLLTLSFRRLEKAQKATQTPAPTVPEERCKEGECPKTVKEWVACGQSLAHAVADLGDSRGYGAILWVAMATMEEGDKMRVSCPVVLHGGSTEDRAMMLSMLLLSVDGLPNGTAIVQNALAQFMERRRGGGVLRKEVLNGVEVQEIEWDTKDPSSTPQAVVTPAGPGEALTSKG